MNGKKTLKNTSALSRRTMSEVIVFRIALAGFIIWGVLLAYPIIWVLLNSIKSAEQYYDNIFYAKPFEFPSEFYFQNYIDAFSKVKLKKGLIESNFWIMLFNTLWYCTLKVGLGLVIPMAAAYALAKCQFPGRMLIYNTMILSSMIPIFGTQGAAYTFYYNLGLVNNPLFVIYTSFGVLGVGLMVSYGYFKTMDKGYAEAVYIDGGNDFVVFFKVMLPMALPLNITFAVLGFIAAWNDSGTFLIYLSEYPTLASGVFELSNGNDTLRFTNPPQYFALLIIMAAPVMIAFSLAADTIMENFSMGGIKG